MQSSIIKDWCLHIFVRYHFNTRLYEIEGTVNPENPFSTHHTPSILSMIMMSKEAIVGFIKFLDRKNIWFGEKKVMCTLEDSIAHGGHYVLCF